MHHRASILLFVLLLPLALASCGPSPSSGSDAGPDGAVAVDAGSSEDAAAPDAGFTCRPGRTGCYGRIHYVCGDDGKTRTHEVLCELGCDPENGCGPCVPDSRSCDGTVSMICNADGTGWRYGRDCAEWGAECLVATGYCNDACAAAEASRTYIGCEYVAAPFAQTSELEARYFDFRIVVANPSELPAEVSVHRGTRLLERRRIVPGGLVEIALPWVEGLSFPEGLEWSSTVVADGAYRVRSDRPVLVTQFNPFHYASLEDGVRYSFTNDASLLLPTHALGDDYVAATYLPTSSAGGSSPPWIAVVGTSPEPTTVKVHASAPIRAEAGGRFEAVDAGETLTFTLARGEVAQLIAEAPPLCDPTRPGYDAESGLCAEPDYDPTGTRIRADKPIAVFSGHVCAYVPFQTPACDHLEAQLAPVRTWGRKYETMPMGDPGVTTGNLIRVVAVEDGTRVTFEPPVGTVREIALDAMEYGELTITGPVSIESNEPVQVAQFLLGMNITDPPRDRGDPSQTMLVPAEQFRTDYVFVTPSSYAETPTGRAYVLVSRVPGTPIELDGTELEAEWTRVGERELAIVQLGGGAHRGRSVAPFGLVAFGLGQYTSYAAPAGLNLNTLY
ncbi:MAG TPA: IgGFc-binding protein [Sandaracinaceae bacterium]